jgi:hypothetical protein
MTKRVNEGVCQWRLTNGKPSFFVNWQDDNGNQYKFFAIRSSCYQFYLRLKDQEAI